MQTTRFYSQTRGFFYMVTTFKGSSVQFSSVQSLSCVCLFATPWIPARQASLCTTNSRSSLKLMSLGWWCHSTISSSVARFSSCPQSFPASVFSNESPLHIRWPKYWSSSFTMSPSVNVQGWFPLGLTGLTPWSSRDSQESSPSPQFESINSSVLNLLNVQLSHPYMTIGKIIALTIWTFVDKLMSVFQHAV